MPFINGKAKNIEDRIKGLEDEARAILGLLVIASTGTIWALTRLTERVTTMNGRTSKLEMMALSTEQSPAGQAITREIDTLKETIHTLTTGLSTVANTSLNHENWHKEDRKQNIPERVGSIEQYIALNRFLIKMLTASMSLVIPTLLGFILLEIFVY